MTATVRRATRGDVAAMLAISNANATVSHANFAIDPERLEDWLEAWDASHCRFPACVAESDGEVVGFSRATPWKGRCA